MFAALWYNKTHKNFIITPMKLNNFFKLVIVITVSESMGIIGSVFTISSISTWYATLAKPALNPPAWIFAPVWTILYFFMGVAAWLVWKRLDSNSRENNKRIKIALAVFALQLLLNLFWSIVLFGLHNPGLAFVNIAGLWLAIVWTVVVFYRISKLAAYLLVPYILWVSFAAYLNFAIWMLN